MDAKFETCGNYYNSTSKVLCRNCVVVPVFRRCVFVMRSCFTFTDVLVRATPARLAACGKGGRGEAGMGGQQVKKPRKEAKKQRPAEEVSIGEWEGGAGGWERRGLVEASHIVVFVDVGLRLGWGGECFCGASSTFFRSSGKGNSRHVMVSPERFKKLAPRGSDRACVGRERFSQIEALRSSTRRRGRNEGVW